MPVTPARSGSPRLSRRSARLALRGDGTLTIACVADTHSQPHPATAERLAAIAPDAIVHAGDIGDPGVIERLAAIAPVFAVRGNIDTRSVFPDLLTLDVVAPEGPDRNDDGDDPGDDERPGGLRPGDRRLRILVTHIAVNGPRLRAEVARTARADQASLVVCGHSHVPFIGRDRELTVFNPGSIGPRRFQLPIVLGTIAITPQAVRLAHVDCETGRPWSPP